MNVWLGKHPNDHNARLLRAGYRNDKKEMRTVARLKRARVDSLIRLYPDCIDLKAYRPVWKYLAGNEVEAITEIESLAVRNSNSEMVKTMRLLVTDSSAMNVFTSLGGYPLAVMSDSMITKCLKRQQ